MMQWRSNKYCSTSRWWWRVDGQRGGDDEEHCLSARRTWGRYTTCYGAQNLTRVCSSTKHHITSHSLLRLDILASLAALIVVPSAPRLPTPLSPSAAVKVAPT